jgi:peptidyl-Asp metalloendopeptidase
MSSRHLLAAVSLVMAAASMSPAHAQGAAPEEVLARPGKLPDVELPSQALRGTGISGEFNPRALAAHRLKFELADGRVLEARRQHEVSDPWRGESWVGEIEGVPGSLVSLTRFRGAVSGFLHEGPDVYEIAAGRGGRHLLYKLDESRLPPLGPSLLPPPRDPAAGDTAAEPVPDAIAAAAADGVVQDILVVYTAASRQRYGEAGVQSRIVNAIAAANQAYANSGLALTLNLVHMAETNYAESGDMGVALTALRSTTDGKMDEVHALRDQHGADLVALINEDQNYCGIAYVMTSVSTGFASAAFSVTASNCLSNQTLAHELGHNQGNMHDRANSSSRGAYDYSYGHRRCVTDGTGFRTVMSYSNNCSVTRINSFSNPTVSYNGYATGIAHETDPANSAEAARSMANTAATVAAFRSGTVSAAPPAPGGLTATAASASRVDLRWTDTVNETSYVVERSGNGVDFSAIASLGTNATAYADNGVSARTNYWYRVRALNSIGSSPPSNVASVVTLDSAPLAPTSVAAAVSGSVVTVTWSDASANEAGFEVARESYNSKNKRWGGLTVVGSTGANATLFNDSPGSGTFRYSVRAVNGGGASAWTGPSGQVSVTSGGSTGGGGKGGKDRR